MRLSSPAVVGVISSSLVLALAPGLDCKDIAVSGLLDSLWFAAAVSVNQSDGDANNNETVVSAEPEPAAGARGADGADGLSCWDLNGDGAGSADEDKNADGNFDALDCQGVAGAAGQDGANGVDGQPGTNGQDGQPGPAGEDGAAGQAGADGQPGANGLSCWDLNGDGVADAEEDINGDGDFNALDCQGPQGEPGQDGLDATGVVARASIRADGATFSATPSGIVTSERLGTGVYEIVVDVTGLDPLPANRDEFTVFVTITANSAEPQGGAGTTLTAFYAIESYDTESKRLTVRVDIIDVQTSLRNNTAFSFMVMGP